MPIIFCEVNCKPSLFGKLLVVVDEVVAAGEDIPDA
jgi:hypothetical protein